MTTTTLDSEGLDAPADVAEPPVPNATSLPARLLEPAATGHGVNASRLAFGLAGLAALEVLPAAACHLCHPAPPEILGPLWMHFPIKALSLPVTATLTWTLPLPGLAILLGVVDRGIPFAHVANAVARAFYRVGLLGLGLTPAVALYAVTGASPRWVEVGTALVYLVSMGLALVSLLRELTHALPERSTSAHVVLLGWAAFVAVFGIHLMERLHVS